jgi:hypothetical protein
VTLADWSSTVLLGQLGITPAHHVVIGAQRPVIGVVARIDGPTLPPTKDTWTWPTPPHLGPGPDLGAIHPHRTLLHWPIALLGIYWLGSSDYPPPPRFVVGRLESLAWIADVVPDYAEGEIKTVIAWDEERIDPLACTLMVRSELDALPLLARHVPIADLPGNPSSGPEPRELSWRQRTLDVKLPRGPRRADWGVALLSPDGRLLDERPVLKRYEQISFALHVDGSDVPASVHVVGDRQSPPSATERDDARAAAIDLENAARDAAAQRRISTSGALEEYIRWRFACRAGELLVLDPHLLDSDAARVVAFLGRLSRPVRALTRSVPVLARPQVNTAPGIEVRALPNGKASLHDRIWIVGETALLVGTSVNSFLRAPAGKPQRATTVTELPHADAAAWRRQFESWWK